ncbi:hypothetical protein [Streptomyces sp. UNOB3_S3]|uniref:hypothetical protein n=1 Tax=Streptomyces sp. UNOB3_S3 TaxID=2871682 RepID=UPI001E5C6BDD|nr:hypothetical protein [Streptomyces sp. UNOB3_S3]MCC3773693.1 hypothetical protein [Streptomyces sp. UNOB3_S3]
MSDTGAESDVDADPLRRIAAAIERERDPSTRTCLTCGGPALVVVREEPAGTSPPVISARKACADQGCERP